MTEVVPSLDSFLRLLAAGGMGALIGAEREMHHKAAGLRTHALVAIGSALFTLIGTEMSGSDSSTRIAAQVVTGVGFLGGGAILHSRGAVQGLTTAASIWVVAALGMACGAGFFALAGLSAVATIVVLAAFMPLDRWLARRSARDAAAGGDGPPPHRGER